MKRKKHKTIRLLKRICIFTGVLMMNSFQSFAAPLDPDTTLNNTIDFVAYWVNKFGAVLAFVGALMLAMGFRNNDAEGKTQGIRVLITGVMVLAIGLKPVYNGIFGLGTP